MKKGFSIHGFTLVEILITLAIAGIAMGAIYGVYESQTKTYSAQIQVVEMQQNLRAGLDMMVREIRMAGYGVGAGIQIATPSKFGSTRDIDDDGTNENITFGFSNANDADGDGIADAGAASLGRDIDGSGFQPIAGNTHALGFAYGVDGNGDGELDTDAGEVIWATIDAGTGNWFDLDVDDDGDIDGDDDTDGDGTIAGENTDITADIADIRAVRIWLLVRTASSLQEKVSNTDTYVVGNRVITPNDDFRRRLLTMIVKCRNLGL